MINVVFDFGAVLFTWQPVSLVQQHFPHLTPTAEAASKLAHDMFAHEDWQNFDRGTNELHDVIERMASRLSLQSDALHGLLGPIGERLTPIAETVQLLKDLRERRETQNDVRLYFLSNMPAPYARVLEERHAFIGWFDGGIFSGDVKLVKPQPEIFHLLEKTYGLAAQDCIFIDDMPVNVKAARDLGWKAILCKSPKDVPAQLDALMKA